MPEINYDWSKFLLRVNINNNAQSIYNAWTSKEQLEKWFLRRADLRGTNGVLKNPGESIIEGDIYQWFWFGYGDEDTEKGTFLTANGKDRISFSFGLAGTVNVSIKIEDSYCLVELTQENIPESAEGQVRYHLSCTKGWLFYLVNLKSYLEGGPDLRNKDENIKGVITA